jgi:hypothetical protein
VAGVPADRVASADAELMPVFSAIEGAVAECRRIRGDAVGYAAHLAADAEKRAGAIIARARAEAESERAAAAARLREASAGELDAVRERARSAAEAVRRRAADDTATVVDRVLRLARNELIMLSTPDGPVVDGVSPT